MIQWNLHRFDVVTSTNDILRGLAASGAEEGAVVTAEEQTRGRGSRGRTWISPPRANLLFSALFRPSLPMDRLGEITFVAAVGVAEALRNRWNLDSKVKWPNDVLVCGKKISGIIIEAVQDAVILGIGVNVNWYDLPEPIAHTATSLAIECGFPVDCEEALETTLRSLDVAYQAYLTDGFEITLERWRRLHETGKTVNVELEGRWTAGEVIDVDDRGRLIVRLKDGKNLTVSAATAVRYGGTN